MSLTVLLIAGLPALLVFSFALISDSRFGLYLLAVAAVAFGLFSGSASFAVFDTLCALVALFAGMGQQNQRQERRRQWNSSSEQQVTLHQTLSARSGGQSPTSSSVASGAMTTGDHKTPPKMPKAIWHDTPEAEKVKLEKEFDDWLTYQNKKD